MRFKDIQKLLVVGSVLGATGLTLGCNRKPKTQKDMASYTIGAQFGKSLKAQNLTLDPDSLARGIVDGYKGEDLKLSEDEMQNSMIKMSEERQKEAKSDADLNKVRGDEFLAKNKTVEGVKVTASGLQYKITAPGYGPSPKGEDVVVVNYKGTLIDGSEFDSSYKRNQPAEFPLKGVIPGWTEGLQLMKKGGKATFWIPSNLAYGERARQQIPGNAVLIFEVDLLDVKSPGVKKK